MAIPETQLETWSHQGSISQSSDTYQTIKHTLESYDTPYFGKNYKVFLQGSYGNDTNIWSESDVDTVIRLDDCYYTDLSDLSEAEKALYQSSRTDASYTSKDFKRDVVKVISDQFGHDVTVGDKAIAISPRGNRRKADVIVAVQYRRYHRFNGFSDQSYASGICFRNKAGELIANFPKYHSDNLTSRHKASNLKLKPMVRVLKNMRGRCVAEGILKDGVAPSYYIEGLLYNVPPEKFVTSYQSSFVNAFTWIQEEAIKKDLVCANEQYYLLRDGFHTCWPTANGEEFISSVIELWDQW